MELFTYLMAKNDHNTSVKKDLFSYLLGKNQSGTYTEFTGTTISANNTKKGKMKVNLLGNISQYTTTGKNLVGTTDVSSTTYNDVTYSITGDTITINGTASANSTLMTTTNFKLGENTTYNLSFISVSGTKDNTYMGLRFRKNGSQVAFIQTNDTTSKTMDLTDIDDVQLYILSGTQFNNFSFKFQLEKGSSKTSYEPYTAGASPNPSYPQDVHIVSGDNTIVSTGKNLLPSYDGITDTINGITFTKNSDGTITANGTATAGINYYVNGYTYATYTPNTYTLSDGIGATGGESSTTFFTYFERPDFTYPLDTYAGTTHTYTESFRGRARIVVRNGVTLNNVVFKPMIEVGSTATTYEPYTSTSYPIHLGDKELCKISTYQDRFIKTTGKNLFDIQSIVKGRLDNGVIGYESNTTNLTLNTGSFSFTTNAGYRGATSDYIQVKNGTYSFNSNALNSSYGCEIASYDENKVWLENASQTALASQTKRTFTISNNAKYIRIYFYLSSAGTITIAEPMLNEGSTPLPYEPYGTNEWYLEKKIGKVVLDGSETIYDDWQNSSHPDMMQYYLKPSFLNNNYIPSSTTSINTLTNYFKCITPTIWNYDEEMFALNNHATYAVQFKILKTTAPTLADFKTWLSTHNTIVYYVLATPTYTPITGTLKDELEAVYNAQSYKGTTNINQINNDLPFNLDVEIKVGN